jgi:hypothetical protein
VNNLLRDFRYGLRVLLKSPGATTVAVLALALGIGANTSCFVWVSALVLHPLAYPDQGRIMTLWETIPKVRAERNAVAPANFTPSSSSLPTSPGTRALPESGIRSAFRPVVFLPSSSRCSD